MDIDVKNLHPLEVKLLRHVSKGEEITAERIIKELDYKVGQCNQAFSWLSAKECLLETGRTRREFSTNSQIWAGTRKSPACP